MIETIVELAIYVISFVCCIVIATEIAQCGLLQIVILERPTKQKVFKALMIGIITISIGVLLQILFKLGFMLTKPENIWLIPIIFLVIPLLWLIFFRYVKMPKSQFDHNKANIWTNYWSRYYYIPGLSLAEPLINSKKVSKILELFNKALIVEEKGTYSFFKHIGSIRMEPIITPTNNKRIAMISLEMAFLYRMMNLYREAHDALDRASSAIEKSLREDPKNEDYLGWKSSIIFHQAETYQAQGIRLQYAKELYEECAIVNTKLTGNKVIKELMNQIDQNFMSQN